MPIKPIPNSNTILLRGLAAVLFITLHHYANGQNLIVNGSMTSNKGSDVVAPGWVLSDNSVTNTPDINDSSGEVLTTQGYVWAGGAPVPSPDGGTWQNTFTGEGVKQVIDGTTVGAIYYFNYYYTAQGITNFLGIGALPNVIINGATGYINPDFSGIPFVWKQYCGALIADSTSIVITVTGSINGGAYMAYDGFYLSQMPLSYPQITQQPLNDSVCENSSTDFTVQASEGSEYFWEANDGHGWFYLTDISPYLHSATNSLIIGNASIGMNNYQYRCYIVGATCPIYSSIATLKVFPSPSPSLTVNAASPEICRGVMLTIKAGSGYKTYVWNDNSTGSAMAIDKPGLFWVQVTDSNNCSGRDSIYIQPCEKFYIPNAFTPNNDGHNDILKPTVFGNVIGYHFSVYNRWGQLVFQTSDLNKGWDGRLDGIPQPTGTYVWNCRFQQVGKKQEDKEGAVLLVR